MNIGANESRKLAMKRSVLFPFAFALVISIGQACIGASAQTGQQVDRAVAAKKFRLSQASEVQLKLTASAQGTSWQTPGAEAAVLSCSIDGQYDQDIIL